MNGTVEDSTVWDGTAISECDDGVILPYNRLSTFGQCNNGAINITGWIMRVEKDSNSYNYSNNSLRVYRYYVSQLVVVVQHDMINNSIVCIHDDISDDESTIIGKISLTSDFAVCNASQNMNDTKGL